MMHIQATAGQFGSGTCIHCRFRIKRQEAKCLVSFTRSLNCVEEDSKVTLQQRRLLEFGLLCQLFKPVSVRLASSYLVAVIKRN